MKTAIVTDTNCSITPAEADSLGIYVLPMPIIIDDKIHYEFVDIDPDTFFEKQAAGSVIKTSQPSFGELTDLWNKALKDHEEIVYIPMSSGLSGACQSAKLYAQDFGGRVHVVDNKRISLTMKQSVLEARDLALKGYPGQEISYLLEASRAESHIYITVDTLTYLKKGGRVTPAAAAVASVLNIKPVLQIQGEKLDSYSKCRGLKAARKIMLSAIASHINEEFGGVSSNRPNAWLGVAYTHNEEEANAFADEIRANFPGYPLDCAELPMCIAAHVGPGALGMACTAPMSCGIPIPGQNEGS